MKHFAELQPQQERIDELARVIHFCAGTGWKHGGKIMGTMDNDLGPTIACCCCLFGMRIN